MITDTKIKVRIVDDDNLLKFQANISGLYKSKRGKLVSNIHNSSSECDIFNLKINKNTKFDLKRIDYTNLSNLIGISVRISGQSKYYCFSVTDEFTSEKKYINGYSLNCNKIYN
jgi:hypothetical protein